MITRAMQKKLLFLSEKFPVVSVNGPRQSGKTTLVKHCFPEKKYVSLELPDNRRFAEEDPRGFLLTYDDAVIDEVQYVPELFSYIQVIIDEKNKPGQYILAGSQNFLLSEKISQSLAGRVAVLTLLPFSCSEIPIESYARYETLLYKGFYPRIYDSDIPPRDYYASYVQTYIERDVRMIRNIGDLSRFHLFLKLCAGRIGQLLNSSSLAGECGISHTTAARWMSVLEASYIVFLLRTHHKNFKKRLVKMPKLYFYDTGLACYLLDVQMSSQLETHYSRGALFESFVIAEYQKERYNRGQAPNCYFWRDKHGHEIDCLIDRGGSIQPVEIKSGRTVNSRFFLPLKYWQKLSGSDATPAIIYGGDIYQSRNGIELYPWKDVSKALDLCEDQKTE